MELIISYQNLKENYNTFCVIPVQYVIIPYQNLKGNYNSDEMDTKRWDIILYQNLEENYNATSSFIGVLLLYYIISKVKIEV